MAGPLEVELKLRFDPADAPALRAHPLVRAASLVQPPREWITHYLDTPDQALRRAGYALRRRWDGRAWIQSVKGDAPSVAGLSQRPEWECPWDEGAGLALSGLPEPVRALLEAASPRLQSWFSTRFIREIRRLEGIGSAVVLLMIDEGAIEAGDRREPLHELELELVQGDPAVLLQLADQLLRDLPLQREDASKAARGQALSADLEHR